jgi:hypothetical protein
VVQEAVGDISTGALEPAVEPEPDGEPDSEPDADLGGAPAADSDGEAPVVVKRKTRRGSRGGKNRRKKPAAAAADEEGGAGVATVVVEGAAAVPDEEPELQHEPAELDQPALAVHEAVVDDAVDENDSGAAAVEDPDEPEPAEAEVPDYVPMSEWLDDFDRR